MNSPKNFVVGFLALTTLGGAILAWQQYGELVELRAAAMNREERRDSQQRIAYLERLNRELQDQLAAQRGGDLSSLVAEASAERPRSERGGERGERGPRGDSRGGGPEMMRQQAAAIRELMAKPEVQAMISAQQKAGIEARYNSLFKNLNLTAEQTDKLTALLAERGYTRRDVEDAARSQGINPRENPEAYRKLFTDAQNEINTSIKSVIGEQGFAQLQNYEQTAPQRNLVENLQQRLASSNAALSSTQAEQLVQILAANSPQRTATTGATGAAEPGSFDRGPGFGPPPGDFGRGGPDVGRMIGGVTGGPGIGPGGPGGGAVVTPAAVAQAQTILAPAQLQALQKIQQTQQSQQQLQQMVRETLAATAKANPGTSSGTGSGSTGATPGAGSSRKRPGGE